MKRPLFSMLRPFAVPLVAAVVLQALADLLTLRETLGQLEGKRLAVRRLDKQTWEVANSGGAFRLRYRVFANELSVRTSYLDDRAALLNGPALFMYQVGAQARPTTNHLQPPRS